MYARATQVASMDRESAADARERGWTALALLVLLVLTLLFGTWVFEILAWVTRIR